MKSRIKRFITRGRADEIPDRKPGPGLHALEHSVTGSEGSLLVGTGGSVVATWDSVDDFLEHISEDVNVE